MIVRQKRADIVGAEGERRKSGRAGLVWMSPQSKMETTRGRWSDVNRERRGVMKKANGSLMR